MGEGGGEGDECLLYLHPPPLVKRAEDVVVAWSCPCRPPVPDENPAPLAGVERVEDGKLIAPWGVIVRERDALLGGLRSFDPASHGASK